ncbi:sugar kinase [Vibrio bivalvicida]|uniref:2-dehydro-3-deoxygluconokinase n=1 Tax=Vibrio bivalvicida TaxID=1276888 RepID=A0A177XZ32_9VIBR|nr:sugar kinase [Vibrio bivalvicida]OAJ93854.1 ketodeoxygluconokinase [Vibrio bivalvicida]
MKTIAIIGECMIELNGKPFSHMQQTFGGDTLNAAVYLCRSHQGLEPAPTVQYVTALGSDPLSKEMKARWEHEGIDTSLVLTDNNHSPGLYLIQLDDKGERTFLYWRDQSAAKYLFQHQEFSIVRQSLKLADMVMISGISLAILPTQDRQQMIQLLNELRASGTEVVFDSNYRPSLWPSDEHSTVRSIYQSMYQATDLALVTFDDEKLIWGDTTPLETIARLESLGIKTVVVKLGPKGCLVSEFGVYEPYQVETTLIENVVDTTSAGDSFNGGFLAAYLEDGDVKRACHNGNQLAGEVIQHKGAIISKSHTNTAKKNFR